MILMPQQAIRSGYSLRHESYLLSSISDLESLIKVGNSFLFKLKCQIGF